MYAETALAIALATPVYLSPAKKLALATWADDGGAVTPGTRGEVVFHAAQSPEWSREAASNQLKDRAARSKRKERGD